MALRTILIQIDTETDERAIKELKSLTRMIVEDAYIDNYDSTNRDGTRVSIHKLNHVLCLGNLTSPGYKSLADASMFDLIDALRDMALSDSLEEDNDD